MLSFGPYKCLELKRSDPCAKLVFVKQKIGFCCRILGANAPSKSSKTMQIPIFEIIKALLIELENVLALTIISCLFIFSYLLDCSGLGTAKYIELLFFSPLRHRPTALVKANPPGTICICMETSRTMEISGGYLQSCRDNRPVVKRT